MVNGLIREGLLHSPEVIEALRKVPRELFLSERLRPHAYSDVPLPTDDGQTISAPHGKADTTLPPLQRSSAPQVMSTRSS